MIVSRGGAATAREMVTILRDATIGEHPSGPIFTYLIFSSYSI